MRHDAVSALGEGRTAAEEADEEEEEEQCWKPDRRKKEGRPKIDDGRKKKVECEEGAEETSSAMLVSAGKQY